MTVMEISIVVNLKPVYRFGLANRYYALIYGLTT